MYSSKISKIQDVNKYFLKLWHKYFTETDDYISYLEQSAMYISTQNTSINKYKKIKCMQLYNSIVKKLSHILYSLEHIKQNLSIQCFQLYNELLNIFNKWSHTSKIRFVNYKIIFENRQIAHYYASFNYNSIEEIIIYVRKLYYWFLYACNVKIY